MHRLTPGRGRGRRITKTISNSGDWNCTYHEYYDRSWRRIEERDGSSQVLRQYMWGPRYVDHIVQIAVNQAPTDDPEFDPEDEDHDAAYYWPAQDANWNVVALFDADGDLVERHAYTPYGERTVYKPVDANDTYGTLEIDETQAVLVDDEPQPYGLCDLGHQGLLLDKEFGAYDNRHRVLLPRLGRFAQRDPIGFRAGISLYQYCETRPTQNHDALGLMVEMSQIISPEEALARARSREQETVQRYMQRNPRGLKMEWGAWRALAQERFRDLGMEFNPGGMSIGQDAFVFTCQFGWLDLGHFFLTGWAYYAQGGSFEKAVAAGYAMEEAQEWARNNIPRGLGPWGDSAYTLEDIPSDIQGATFAEFIDEEGAKTLDKNLGLMIPDIMHPQRPSRPTLPLSLADFLRSHFQVAEAVSLARPEVRKILQADVKSMQNDEGTYKDSLRPYGRTFADSYAFQRTGIAFGCLCNPDGTAKKEYKWQP